MTEGGGRQSGAETQIGKPNLDDSRREGQRVTRTKRSRDRQGSQNRAGKATVREVGGAGPAEGRRWATAQNRPIFALVHTTRKGPANIQDPQWDGLGMPRGNEVKLEAMKM